MGKDRKIIPGKNRINFTLKGEVIRRLDILEKNAKKLYGKKCSRSEILEILVMNTEDPIDRLKKRKREILMEANRIDSEIDALEERRKK